MKLRDHMTLNEEAMKAVEQRMGAMQPGQSTWMSFFLYWSFMVCLIVGISYLIKLFADGRIKLKQS